MAFDLEQNKGKTSIAEQVKISCIHSSLESALAMSGSDGASVPTCPIVCDTSQFIQSENMDWILGSLMTITVVVQSHS